ncbi:MAG: hypothetical protein A3H27_12730 [Acidobacteria bacterium RIFCSPLOWO2_02_FULL_59_13]|nr:MAG: hypothetical protein A3H27_12730 [Acidobacteria bacterium RIFCSPLOWO2_02_FULL_59_13]
MSELVSVVIPCFNYAHFLAECMESLFRQSYRDWECIIVDDGSSDNTPALGARLCGADPRIRYMRQHNAGLSAARNAGLREARGTFVQLLDADDLLQPDKLTVQAEFLRRHSEFDAVVGPAAYFEGLPPYTLVPWRSQGDVGLAAFIGYNVCPVNAVLARRALFESVGFFDESLPAHEDWDFWLRSLLRGKRFGFTGQGNDCAMVRLHEASMSAAKAGMLRSAIKLRARVHKLLPPLLQQENGARIAETKWRLGLTLMREGKRAEGWPLYLEGLRDAERKSAALLRLPLMVPGINAAVQFGRRLLR